MPSLTDIPEDIRDNPNPAKFMNWLTPIKISPRVKQALARIWMHNTNTRLPREAWLSIEPEPRKTVR